MEPNRTFIELRAAGGLLPNELQIFPAGDVRTLKGTFKFTADAATSVLTEYRTHGTDLPFDYDHKMLDQSAAPEAGKAAGWFALEVRNGALWATNIRWTPAGAQAVRDREFRYLSPAFFADRDGVVRKLINVALTNLPATREAQPIVAKADPAATMIATTATTVPDGFGSLVRASLGLAAEVTDAMVHSHVIGLAAEAQRATALETELTELKSKIARAEGEQAEREVDWIIAHAERYDLQAWKDPAGGKRMLLAARAADPATFAFAYKAALDGMRAGDTDDMFLDSASLTGKPNTDERKFTGDDATGALMDRAKAIHAKHGVSLGDAMALAHREAMSEVG